MRKQVTMLQCSRCGRVENLDDSTKELARSISITFSGETKSLEDLCSPCLELVQKSVEVVFKAVAKKSSIRKKKDPSVAPSVVATSGSNTPALSNGAKKDGPHVHLSPPGKAPRA